MSSRGYGRGRGRISGGRLEEVEPMQRVAGVSATKRLYRGAKITLQGEYVDATKVLLRMEPCNIILAPLQSEIQFMLDPVSMTMTVLL